MEKIKVIIDCDTGIDDSIAIMLALLSKKIEVVGISVCSGNTYMKNAYLNTKRVLKLMNRDDVPVFMGKSKPMVKKLVVADETHGEDGFGCYSEEFDKKYGFNYENELKKFSTSYSENENIIYLKDLVEKNPDCILVSIGPMTNIAAFLNEYPETFKKISRLISMGGNYKSHGNTSPVAEYNYWVDPEAAKFVYLNSPIKVEMVGLDVTRNIVLTREKLNYIKSINSYIGNFIENLTEFYFNFHWEYEKIKGCVINDPLVIAFLIDDTILSGFTSYTDISTTDITRGQSVVDSYNFYGKIHNSIIYTEVNSFKFFEILYSEIGGIENV